VVGRVVKVDQVTPREGSHLKPVRF